MNGFLGIGAVARPAPIAELDYAVVGIAGFLLALGLIMVYSSSIAIAEGGRFTGNQSTYYLVRHGVFLFVGLMAGYICFQFPLNFWEQAAPYFFCLGVLLLMLVLIPGVGREVNGSRRWLSLGLFNLQPSELMKLFAVLYAADYTVRKAALMHSFRKGFLPMLGVMTWDSRNSSPSDLAVGSKSVNVLNYPTGSGSYSTVDIDSKQFDALTSSIMMIELIATTRKRLRNSEC